LGTRLSKIRADCPGPNLVPIHVWLRQMRRLHVTQRLDWRMNWSLNVWRIGVGARRADGQMQFRGPFDDRFGRLQRAMFDARELNIGADIAQLFLNLAELVAEIDLLLTVVDGEQSGAGENSE